MPKRRAKVRVASRGPTRAQQAAEFSRKKHKQRVKQFKRRGLMVASVALAAYVGIGGWWLYHTGRIERAATQASESFWQMTANSGFRLNQVYLTGRRHADMAAVKKAIDVAPGAPILALELADMRQKLEAIAEVKAAHVSRTLPGTLRIVLVERQPAALWQRAGKHVMVDEQGVVLANDHYRMEQPLPVIVGEDAPQHVRELIGLLESAPGMRPQVAAAVRIGSRRWNVRLTNNVTVLLPQEQPEQAWQRFAELVEREGLLTKAIRSVDMRMEDRVFIMPMEQQKNPITLTTARDT